jgi:hypothetical protein
MRFHIQGQGGLQLFAAPQGNVLRLPAGFGAGATSFVQGIEKCIRQEWIGIGLQGDQFVPGSLTDLGKRRNDSRAIIHYGFSLVTIIMTIKVAIAQIKSTVGDLAGNRARIVDYARRAAEQGADIVLTPELSLVGYPPEDLLLRQSFYAKTAEAVAALAAELSSLRDVHVVVGHPTIREGMHYNAASVIVNGKVFGTYCKCDLPNDTFFFSARTFRVRRQRREVRHQYLRRHVVIAYTGKGQSSWRASALGAERLALPYEQATSAL